MTAIVWCVVLLAASALPGALPLPTAAIAGSALLLAVPSFVITLFACLLFNVRQTGNRARASRAMFRLVGETVPAGLLIAGGLLFAGFWLVGVQSVGGAGVPEQRAGEYVTNNHGIVTVISEDEYLTLKEQGRRIPVAIAGGLSVFAAVFSTALVRREEQRETSATSRGPAPG
ncbi:hypothetical protein SAMN05421684_7367 [Asanoa ishikariensis]|uniref:Uncharacterized protein n=1 Tax=Asanoa ishikariensis TaxID=137265 RepID=A0A1H3UJY6_9ACTN|nr:hypothetical protein SAMN05421684_7367 [Asanoa ishikariensis]